MAFKADIEIAREARKKPIMEIGAKLGIPAEHLLPYGHDKAKIGQAFIGALEARPMGKLILVTAINPTPAGEGKTTTTVGLGDGLNRIGKKAIICIREASLGPNFGMKGGAAGGGYSVNKGSDTVKRNASNKGSDTVRRNAPRRGKGDRFIFATGKMYLTPFLCYGMFRKL